MSKKEVDNLEQTESAYLSQASTFKSHLEDLDPVGCSLLDQIQNLKKSSIDPRHLTIVHEKLTKKIAQIILKRTNNTSTQIDNDKDKVVSSLFVEFHPGFGLVTKSILQQIEENKSQKLNFRDYILVESFSKFEKHLKDLADGEQAKRNKSNVTIIRRKPFEMNFLFKVQSSDKQSKQFIDLINKSSPQISHMTIFGVLPWNCKGYLSKLMGDFASDRSLFTFRHVRTTDFYLYVPDFLMTKLKPDYYRKKPSLNNTCLSVLAALLPTKLDIVDRQPCDYFFPYPVLGNPSKYKRMFSSNSNNSVNKLSLVNVRFDRFDHNENETNKIVRSEHKRLLYLFVSQMFVRPTVCLKDALRSVKRNFYFFVYSSILVISKCIFYFFLGMQKRGSSMQSKFDIALFTN